MKMKKVWTAVFGIMLVSSLMAGCGNSTAPKEEGVTFSKNTLTVTLAGNMTTGYSWAQNISDSTVISFVQDTYSAKSSESGAVGVGGFDVFTFQGLKAGNAKITFTYARQWEDTSEDTRSVEVDAVVDDKGNITSATMSESSASTGSGAASSASQASASSTQ